MRTSVVQRGMDATSELLVTPSDAAMGDQFGTVAIAGDVDNDGYLDLIVGADWDDDVAADAGAAYVMYGDCIDVDADGYCIKDGDCNDDDGTVYPKAPGDTGGRCRQQL